MADRFVRHTTVLPGGAEATVVVAPAAVSGPELTNALGIDGARGLLVLNGGTQELAPAEAERLRLLFREGLAPVVTAAGVTVVTGATDAGIFRLLGEALDGKATAPVIGVAPAGRVGSDSEGQRVSLEPHHTHFVLVEGAEWGDETASMLSLSKALAASAPSVAVVASGGSIARREVLGNVRAGREVIVLAGSGRLADEIVAVVTGHAPAADAEMSEIAAGRITVVDATAPPSALASLLRARLATTTVKTRRSLRSIALFAPLPRIRFRPVAPYPFVPEAAIAGAPDLRADFDVLDRELFPTFAALDVASLRTQNTFRLGQLSLIVGGAASTVLGAIQAAAGGGVVWLAFPEAIVAGVLAGATVYIRGRDAQREYFTSRLRAERLRAEYFLALARAGDYAGAADDDDRLRLLRQRVRAIEASGESS